MTQAVAKKDMQQKQQQVQQQKQFANDVETQEHHASANASVCFSKSPAHTTPSSLPALV
jgi:hypothetical protein